MSQCGVARQCTAAARLGVVRMAAGANYFQGGGLTCLAIGKHGRCEREDLTARRLHWRMTFVQVSPTSWFAAHGHESGFPSVIVTIRSTATFGNVCVKPEGQRTSKAAVVSA